ncbi:hypothetical protein [Formosa sp. S-31]|uniref:hypothetical protein n=1 Tax=Formosa sp. S-31 TaxID=2790949 RepID=UPI003EC101EC
MNKNISILMGILAVVSVIFSFFGNLTSANILGFEINIWAYRMIWSMLAIFVLFPHYKRWKANR